MGTESRFFSILHKLKEIVTESEQDPEQKIAVLETRKAEIEQETEEIRRTVAVRTLPEVRIRIQYLYARREAAELISDFRIVESNFADATREIHKKYLETSLKGEIIEFVLDQDQELFFKRLRGLLREAWSRVNSVVSELSEQLKRSVIDKTVHEISKFCTV